MATRQAGEQLPEGGLDVLLVDDEPDVRFAVSRLLQSAGHRVVGQAGDAERALELATDHQPDVIVLDLMLPGRSGQDVLPELVDRCPHTMIVVFSALDGQVLRDALFSAGASAYYAKSNLPHLVTLLASDHRRFCEDLDPASVDAGIGEDPPR